MGEADEAEVANDVPATQRLGRPGAETCARRPLPFGETTQDQHGEPGEHEQRHGSGERRDELHHQDGAEDDLEPGKHGHHVRRCSEPTGLFRPPRPGRELRTTGHQEHESEQDRRDQPDGRHDVRS